MMKIADDDKVYELLDQWHDEDEYDQILQTIFEIPREEWSNKLWFRVISAYNNKEEFSNAIEELEQMKEHCSSVKDIAKWHYMYAYIFYANNQYVVAKNLLDKSVEADPENEDYASLKEECQEYIDKKIDVLREILTYIREVAEKIQKEEKEKGELKDCEGNEFWALLSFPASLRIVPGIPHCMGMNAFYKCSSQEEKEQLKEWLKSTYNITDFESTKEAIFSFHSGADYMGFVSFWNGTGFDLDELDSVSRASFEACKYFGEVIREYVTDTGIFAADLTEMMFLLRMAYACDLIGNYDYCKTATEIEDIAKRYYNSWLEYAMAYYCGGAYSIYSSNFSKLKDTIDFLKRMLSLLPYLDYWYYNWESDEQ